MEAELEDGNDFLSSNYTIGTTVPPINSTASIGRDSLFNGTMPMNDQAKVQKDAPIELRVISQPQDKPHIDIRHYSNYVYNADAGKGVFIYHAELGVNTNHKDFQDRPGAIEWLYTPLAVRLGQATETEGSSPKYGHSTCTASKAAGNVCGPAKKATLVVVKAPSVIASALLETLSTIYGDVSQNNRQDISIVTISWSIRQLPPRLLRLMKLSLQYLITLGVVVMCAAGNHVDQTTGSRLRVDTYPAVLESYTIGVGNSDNYGRRWATSQQTSYDSQLHAPGVNVRCADVKSDEGYRTGTGTSLCKSIQ